MGSQTRAQSEAEFAAILAREFPAKSEREVGAFAAELMRLGRLSKHYELKSCNDGLSELEERQEADTDIRASELCGAFGIDLHLTGDPRGATYKVELPSGRSNSIGGNHWCVPGS